MITTVAPPDHYAVLGVDPAATADEVRSAYRRLALQWHPDRNSDPGAAERFHEIATAYKSLRDPVERRAYDRVLPPRPWLDPAAVSFGTVSDRLPRTVTLGLFNTYGCVSRLKMVPQSGRFWHCSAVRAVGTGSVVAEFDVQLDPDAAVAGRNEERVLVVVNGSVEVELLITADLRVPAVHAAPRSGTPAPSASRPAVAPQSPPVPRAVAHQIAVDENTARYGPSDQLAAARARLVAQLWEPPHGRLASLAGGAGVAFIPAVLLWGRLSLLMAMPGGPAQVVAVAGVLSIVLSVCRLRQREHRSARAQVEIRALSARIGCGRAGCARKPCVHYR